jgi:hypothetical protein
MANSRGRRKLKRLLQEQGLSVPLKVPVIDAPPAALPPPPPKHPSRWNRIPWGKVPGWCWTLIVIFSVLITVLEAYPWLSIQRDDSLDPSNPYATTFIVTNDGYLPITDLDVICDPEVVYNQRGMGYFSVSENDMHFPPFSSYLAHSEKTTLPCFDVLNMDTGMASGIRKANLTVTVTYAFIHPNIKPLRRSQRFSFHGVKGKDGSWHWIYGKSPN